MHEFTLPNGYLICNALDKGMPSWFGQGGCWERDAQIMDGEVDNSTGEELCWERDAQANLLFTASDRSNLTLNIVTTQARSLSKELEDFICQAKVSGYRCDEQDQAVYIQRNSVFDLSCG
jgi:hypothetical protein